MTRVDVLISSTRVGGLVWVLADWHGWKARQAEQPHAAIFVAQELPLVKRSGLARQLTELKRVFPGAMIEEVRSLRPRRGWGRRREAAEADEAV